MRLVSGSSVDLDDVLRRRTLLTCHQVELDAITLGQGAETVALNRGVVDEAIPVLIVERDETEALRVVEPLDYACTTHALLLLVRSPDPWGAWEQPLAMANR